MNRCATFVLAVSLCGIQAGCQSDRNTAGVAPAPVRLMEDETPFVNMSRLQTVESDSGVFATATPDVLEATRGTGSGLPSPSARYRVLYGPIGSTAGKISLDKADAPTPTNAGEAAFTTMSGFTFAIRPWRWPLGRTSRIPGGTIGVPMIPAPGESAGPSPTINCPSTEMSFALSTDESGVQRVFYFGSTTDCVPSYRIGGIDVPAGYYVESVGTTVTGPFQIRTAPQPVIDLVETVRRTAVAKGLAWKRYPGEP